MMRRGSVAAAVTASALLGGCLDKAGISGAAMMRVEVEVYKGPVGQSREVQIGELSALLAQTVLAMRDWKARFSVCKDQTADCVILNQAHASASDISDAICKLNAGTPYALLRSRAAEGGVMTIDNACGRAAGGRREASAGETILADTEVNAEPRTDRIFAQRAEYARRVSVVASEMQIIANRQVGAMVGYVPRNDTVRYAITSLNYQLTQLARNIAARNATLQKVLQRCGGIAPEAECEDAGKLPTGDYLQDVDPSRFVDAFGWFNAALESKGTGALSRRDRTRVIQALTADYYWSKVNEVYASGQGDVSMAFIKDELGNWNLKSYTNDPARLLSAYRGATNAALSTVAKLARSAAGDPTAVAKGSAVLDLADRLATGKPTAAPSIGMLGLADLRRRTRERLDTMKARTEARETALLGPATTQGLPRTGGELTALEASARAAGDAAEAARQAASVRQAERDAQQTRLAGCPADATCVQALSDAITTLGVAQAEYQSRLTAQRTAEAKLAVAQAEASTLSDRAAEGVDQILGEYQHDLATLQQAVSAGATAATQSPTAER